MKKRIISVLAALALCLALCADASAALTAEVSPTSIAAGESVTVTLRVTGGMTGVTGMDHRVYFDPNVFALTGSVRGTASTLATLSSQRTDPTGAAYCSVSVVDPASAGVTVAAGVLYTLTFTARTDLSGDASAAFRVMRHAYMDTGFAPVYTDDVTGGNITVTVSKVPEATVESASLTLLGQIGVNFYVALPDEVANDAAACAVFTFKGAGDEPILVRDAPTDTLNGVTRRVFTRFVAAKEMSELITLRIYTGSGDQVMLKNSSGELMSGGAARYSVARYVQSVTSSAGQALAGKLAGFGARAMAYFDYAPVEEDASAASSITAAEEPDVTSDVMLLFKPTSSGSVSGLTARGISLTLDTLTAVNLSFALSDGHAIGEYAFTLNGTDVTSQLCPSDGRYYLSIPNIPAKELDTVYTVVVSRGTQRLTLTCSALSYAYNALKTGEGAADRAQLCDLVRALYAYNRQADEYFA